MSQRIYVQLGRIGDQLNVLPMLYDDSQKGGRSAMMVSKDFQDVMDGVSYADKIVFDGGMWDLAQAVKQAELISQDVKVVQLVGPEEIVKAVVKTRNGPEYRAKTDSFQKDQWFLADRVSDWKRQIPLVLDRRDPQREEKLTKQYLPNRKKHILLATNGISSPFPYSPLLHELLTLKFSRQYNIIDLATVKAEKFFDLLGLYEHPDTHCIVATDSAPLHLAYATKLPVVALVNDRPSFWHGSSWRANHVTYIRYHEFAERAVEILDDIQFIGKPGSYFNKGLVSPKIVHVWSMYEDGRDCAEWKPIYDRSPFRWVATPFEPGASGRSSKSELKDEKRLPYLKDVIRIATLRAEDGDIICLTRADTLPCEELTNRVLLALDKPVYARRNTMMNGLVSYHPSVDLFAFTKLWWKQHQTEMPDMILGKDIYWQRILTELLKIQGGIELPFGTIYCKPKQQNTP